jgi:hypothetical protein
LQVLAFCEALAEASGLHQHLVLQTRVLRIDPVLPSSSGHLPASHPLNQHHNLQWRVVTAIECPAAAGAAARQALVQDATQQRPQGQQEQLQRDWPVDLQQHQQPQQWQKAGRPEGRKNAVQQELVFDAVANCVGTFSEISLPQVFIPDCAYSLHITLAVTVCDSSCCSSSDV